MFPELKAPPGVSCLEVLCQGRKICVLAHPSVRYELTQVQGKGTKVRVTRSPRRARSVTPTGEEDSLRRDSGATRPGPAYLMTLSSLLVHDLQSFGLDNVRTRWRPWRLGCLETGVLMSDMGDRETPLHCLADALDSGQRRGCGVHP